MNRVGYNLPEVSLPGRMPGWAREMTIATQAVMDAQYLHGPGGLDNFYDQAEAWIQTQSVKRGNSGDPKNYKCDPFRMSIPRRQIVDYDQDGNMNPYWAEPDPNIHLPELPVWVEPSANGNPGFQKATAPDQAQAQMMAAVMAKLVAIEQRLIAVLGK